MASLINSVMLAGNSGGTTAPADFTGATLLVAVVAAGTISDSLSNSWTSAGSCGTGKNWDATFYYCLTPAVGAAQTFTRAGGFASFPFAVIGFSGPTGYDTKTLNPVSSNGTTQTTGSITPAGANEVLIFGATYYSNDVTSDVTGVSAGTLALHAPPNNSGYPAGNCSVAIGYEIQTSATTRNVTFSLSGSGSEPTAGILAFTTSGGGSIIPLVMHHRRQQGMS